MTAAIRRAKIIKDLTNIPDSDLDAIQAYVRTVLSKVDRPPRSRRNLAGIWRGKGFEKVGDLEAELREVRRQLGDAIDRRSV